MKRKSRIFTNAELIMIDQRAQGSKKDPCGLWAGRIKPKIKELLELNLAELKKLIE